MISVRWALPQITSPRKAGTLSQAQSGVGAFSLPRGQRPLPPRPRRGSIFNLFCLRAQVQSVKWLGPWRCSLCLPFSVARSPPPPPPEIWLSAGSDFCLGEQLISLSHVPLMNQMKKKNLRESQFGLCVLITVVPLKTGLMAACDIRGHECQSPVLSWCVAVILK